MAIEMTDVAVIGILIQRSALIYRMRGAFTICMVMFGNGVWIGMAASNLVQIPRALARDLDRTA